MSSRPKPTAEQSQEDVGEEELASLLAPFEVTSRTTNNLQKRNKRFFFLAVLCGSILLLFILVFMTTDEVGNYMTTVPAGKTVIDMDESTLPPGAVQTAETDPTIVTVPSGSAAADIDDFQLQGKVKGTVFRDANNNGKQDDGDPSIEGLNIAITESLGNTQEVRKDDGGLSKDRSKERCFECAPWIPREQRRVTLGFGGMGTTWEDYQEGRGYLGGEAYWVASLSYVLTMLGFEPVRINNASLVPQMLQQGRAHRAIYNAFRAVASRANTTFSSPLNEDVLCKIRWMDWWRGDKKVYADGFIYHTTPDPRYSVVPFPTVKTNAAFIGFFVHSQVTLPPVDAKGATRERKGFLLSKKCQYHAPSVVALLEAGFELHTTCTDEEMPIYIPRHLTHLLVNRGRMLPADFAFMLRSMAFVAGFGQPFDSPTPYEGMANGAAFLNPIASNGRAQHEPLKSLGVPYVYNYNQVKDDDNQTAANLVEVAERAYTNRFTSFVPQEHTLPSVMGQVCSNLIESDQVCHCTKLRRQGKDSRGCDGQLTETSP